MTISNPKYQKHIAAWKKLRNEIFIPQEGQDVRALFPDPEYEKIVRRVARSLAKRDAEEKDFTEYLKIALDKVAKQFVLESVSTKLEDIYDLTAYSLVYGARSVAEVQVALLEYFLDSSRAYFEDTVRILDLGSGTGASFFGIISFLKKYSKHFKFFKDNVKEIIIEFVEKEPLHFTFCHELTSHLQSQQASFPKITFIPTHGSIEDFLNKKGIHNYDFIIVSKSISELDCLQRPTLNVAAYSDILGLILHRVNQEGVFILIEPPRWSDPIRKILIPFTVKTVTKLGAYVYSPCPKDSECFESEVCSAWRVFKYLEPEYSKEIRTQDRGLDKFYLLLVTKDEHSIDAEIISTAEMKEHRELKFAGLFHPSQVDHRACWPIDVTGTYYYPQEWRGKYLFKDFYDELFIFGLDIERYWTKVSHNHN